MDFNDNFNSPNFNTFGSNTPNKQIPFDQNSTNENDDEPQILKNYNHIFDSQKQSPRKSTGGEFEFLKSKQSLSTSEKKILDLVVIKEKLKSQGKCLDHPEEDLLFICYNCKKKAVCIECVSKGVHKNHEIINCKKAIIDVKQILCQNVQKLKCKISNYNKEITQLQTKKQEIFDNNNENKLKVQAQFADLKKIMKIKEKQLIGNLDDFIQKQQKSLEDFILGFKRKINIYTHSCKTIQSIVTTLDDLALCNYYHYKQDDIATLCEYSRTKNPQNECYQLYKIKQNVENFQCNFDDKEFQSIRDQIKSLQINFKQKNDKVSRVSFVDQITDKISSIECDQIRNSSKVYDQQRGIQFENKLCDASCNNSLMARKASQERIQKMKNFIETKCNSSFKGSSIYNQSESQQNMKTKRKNEESESCNKVQSGGSVIKKNETQRSFNSKKLDELQQLINSNQILSKTFTSKTQSFLQLDKKVQVVEEVINTKKKLDTNGNSKFNKFIKKIDIDNYIQTNVSKFTK